MRLKQRQLARWLHWAGMVATSAKIIATVLAILKES